MFERHGWQNQKDLKTIQGEIENAIFKLTKENVAIYAASRTDAGVHAFGQVAHFQLEKYYKIYEIQNAINHYLKSEKISIINIEKVDMDFHARFSNKTKQYVYKIIVGEIVENVPTWSYLTANLHITWGTDFT